MTEPVEISETTETLEFPFESTDGATPDEAYGDEPVLVEQTTEVYFDKEL